LCGRQLDVRSSSAPSSSLEADHLGQHHGDDLEVLDLLLVIDPLGAVLDDQHADGPAAAQQRHAEEGVVGIFARFRTVRELRVAGASDRFSGRPRRMVSPTRPSPGFSRVTWTASRARPSVANSSRSLDARRR
jgi:hypothetical protein